MMNRGVFRKSLTSIIKEIIMPDYIMDYLCYMRKACFYSSRSGLLNRIFSNYYGLKQRKLGIKLGFSIAKDTLGYATLIPHYGTIVVGSGNRIGNYAVLHTSTCITHGKNIVGDGLCLSTGAKIVGENLILSDNVSVSANVVVNETDR